MFDHIVGGAGEERTVAANRAGFGKYRLIPRVLAGVADVDTGVELLGTRLVAPIFTAPTGNISLVHPNAECAVAAGAAAAGVGFILASSSSIALEEVGLMAGPARWHQLYWQGNRDIMADLVQRAESAGFRAIVLTVDQPMGTRRPRMIRNGFKFPIEASARNFERYAAAGWARQVGHEVSGFARGPDLALTWKNVEWLRSIAKVPLVLKGIMQPRDALKAIDVGVDAIIVSNHGGRSLDGEPGTIEVLEEIARSVGGRIPVLIDGGIRRATDIAIALGLGASAVAIGSPVVFALACGGQDTVAAYLEDLVEDLARTLGLLGISAVGELTRDFVSRKDEYLADTALVPFLPPR